MNKEDRIKRSYPVDDFNPYGVIKYAYDNYVPRGLGTKILVVGYSPRFTGHIGNALRHVTRELQLERPHVFENMTTLHSGATMEFLVINDEGKNQQALEDAIDRSTNILFCNKFNCPEILSVVHFKQNLVTFEDFSENNFRK